ncbi:MAG: TetR/AcrR family transcriptional regulator [Acidimicrobiales bacterium]
MGAPPLIPVTPGPGAPDEDHAGKDHAGKAVLGLGDPGRSIEPNPGLWAPVIVEADRFSPGTVVTMSDGKWRRGESRERLVRAALQSVCAVGPSAVSGRAVAREAGVYNAQVQQMFGSVAELVNEAVMAERNRYVERVFPPTGLPDPLAVAEHPDLWRSITQVILDPGPVDMRALASGGPLALLGQRLGAEDPERSPSLNATIAAAWVAAPLGALIFQDPLRRGLALGGTDWDHCFNQLGVLLQALAEQRSLPSVRAPDRRRGSGEGHGDVQGGRARLVVAAEDLLGSRLEAAVTGRELALHAGVNYGLVTHYFGSKSAVFDAALENLHRRFLRDVLAENAERPDEVDVHEVFIAHRAFIRAWAARLLGDRPVPEFELLGMADLVARLGRLDARRKGDGQDPVVRALAVISLQLGWTILEPLPASARPREASPLGTELRQVHRWMLTSR